MIYVFCIQLAVCTFSLIFFTNVKQLFVVCIVVGLANGGYLTMETSLAVDSLEKMKEEYKEKRSSDIQLISDDADVEEMEGAAQLLGIWGVAAFFGLALGPLIGGPLLFFFGKLDEDDIDNGYGDDYVGGQQYSLLGYTIVFALSALYFLSAGISLFWVKNCK